MNPCHSSWENALTYAYRLIRTGKEFGELRIELSEEQTITINSIVKQLYGCRRSQIRVLPSPKLPDHLAVFIHLYSLYWSIGRVHRRLAPLVIPVINDMVPILQTDSFLWLGHTKIRRIHFPYSLAQACYLLYMSLTTCDKQISLRQLLNTPWKESVPTINLLAIAIILMYTTQSHVGNEQRASTGESCITELSVNRSLFADREFKLSDDTF